MTTKCIVLLSKRNPTGSLSDVSIRCPPHMDHDPTLHMSYCHYRHFSSLSPCSLVLNWQSDPQVLQNIIISMQLLFKSFLFLMFLFSSHKYYLPTLMITFALLVCNYTKSYQLFCDCRHDPSIHSNTKELTLMNVRLPLIK